MNTSVRFRTGDKLAPVGYKMGTAELIIMAYIADNLRHIVCYNGKFIPDVKLTMRI